MRVQLLNQTLLDLGLYDDGPYEVADQKQLNAQLIPVPYHSYLGRICPPCSLLPVHRTGREGQGRATVGLRLYPSMAVIDIGASSRRKLPVTGNFLWIIFVKAFFLMLTSVYVGGGSTSDMNSYDASIRSSLECLTFLEEQGKHLPKKPSSKNKAMKNMEREWCTTSQGAI